MEEEIATTKEEPIDGRSSERSKETRGKNWVNERKRDFMKSRVGGEERKRWASGNRRKGARGHMWMNTRM